jgi:large subunit ribosomal protein L11
MNDNKKSYKIIRLQIIAGKASPSSSIGPALGQHGINIMNFCKDFNKRTMDYEELPLTAVIKIYTNKSYNFILKQPPTSILIKKTLNLALTKKPSSGSKNPGKEIIGTINYAQLEEIAKLKEPDLSSYNVERAVKIIAGTAKSMGIEIKD